MKQGRRFLSLVLALVMVFSIAPITVFASGDPLDDIEITTNDKTYYYGLDSYLKYDNDAEEYYCCFYTNLNDDFSVTLPGEEEEYTTDFWYQDVFYRLTLNKGLSDIQSYDNQWAAGNIYTLVYDLYYRDEDYEYIKTSKSYEINYTILDNPISSISIDDIYVYDGLDDKRKSYYDWDAEKSVYYYIRGYEPRWDDVTIYFKNGDVSEGDSFYFNDRYYYLDYECKDEQTKDSAWEVGSTHTATATLGTMSTTYNVEVRENPVASVSVANKVMYEGYDSETCSSWVSGDLMEYQGYDIDASDEDIIVTFKDGKVKKGDYIYYDGRSYYMNYFCDDDQSYSNQWAAGTTHTVEARFGGVSTQYTIKIKENPIKSFAFTEDAMTLYSGGRDVPYPELEFVVTPKVGNPVTCKGYYEVDGRKFKPEIVSDPQDKGKLEVGKTYTVKYKMLGKTDSIKYTIKASKYSFYESYDGEGVVITGINLTSNTEVLELPSKINGQPVVRFYINNENKYYKSVKKLVLSSSVNSLNYWDISSLTNLEEVVLGSKTEDINFEYFFRYKENLKITIPETSKYFSADSKAIYNAKKTAIKYVFAKTGTFTVPDTVKDISILAGRAYDGLTVKINSTNPYFVKSYGVIYNKDKTKVILCDTSKSGSYTMPSSVTEVAGDAFAGCSNLTSVSISPNVTKLVYGEFSDCTGLTSVSLPSSLVSIGSRSFSGCSGLTSVQLPESLTRVEYQSFYRSGLTSIDFPDSLKEVGSYAFAGTKLTSVYIPNTLQEIGGYAFAYTNINSATFGDEIDSLEYGMFAGTKFTSFKNPSNITYIGGNCFAGCSKLKTVSISNATIGGGAFSYCTALTSVKLPNCISSIYGYTFNGCTSLKSIVIPDSVQNIERSAFQGSGLTVLEIPQTVVSIAYNCFRDAESLADIQLPSSAVKIGANAFHNTAWYNSQPTTGLIYLGNVLYGTKADSVGTKLTVKSGTKVIADYAFDGHSEIKTLSLPEGLEIIGEKAFFGCSGLTSVKIPSTLYNLSYWYYDYDADACESYIYGNAAFSGCNNITYSVAKGNKSITLNSHGYPSPLARYESNREIIKAATSTETGFAAKINENGDKTDYVSPITLPVICDHTIVAGITTTKSATCTTAGNTLYWTCSKCGKYFSDAEGTNEICRNAWIIPAKGHKLTKTAAKAATCTEKGNSAYYYCSTCGKYFKYSSAKTEIEKNSWILAATGHSYDSSTQLCKSCGKVNPSYKGIVKVNGVWKYYVSGKLNTSYKGIAKRSDGTYWYVESGTIKKKTGLYKMPSGSTYQGGNIVYLSSGKFTTCTGLYKMPTSSSYRGGEYAYVEKGVLNTSYRGLAKKTDGTYWYVESGKINTKMTGKYSIPKTSKYYAGKTVTLSKGKKV